MGAPNGVSRALSLALMDWDMTASSWDLDNFMLFSYRELGQTEATEPVEVEEIPCKISMEHMDNQTSNIGFLGLRNQVDSQEGSLGNAQGNSSSSSKAMGNRTEHHSKHAVLTPQRSPFLGSGSKTGGGNANVEKSKDSKQNSIVDGSGEDCHIGLKLGKRTYYSEDANVGGAIKATSQVSVFSSSPVQSKKPRALAQASQTPRCQVEGCNKELTCAKDYHRRHKVCEVHSKTAKVTVNGIEQRFCQQCSRFHELMEFDEGKRSCRRRLAGHNERRRKPQHDPMGINSARLLPSFHDNRLGSYLTDRPFFMHPRMNSNTVLEDPSEFRDGNGNKTWPRFIKTEDQLPYDRHPHIPGIDQQSYSTSERLLLFLHNSKILSENVVNQGYPQYIQSSGGPVGQALTLSSSSGTVSSGLEVTSTLQSLSGVSDSGRALSLLSSPSWASRASGSGSLNMATRSAITLDQLVHNQPPMAVPLMQGLQQNYDLAEDKLLTISPQTPASLVSSAFSATGGNSLDKEQTSATLDTNTGCIGNFETRMPSLFQVPGSRGSQGGSPQDARCTMDLMRRSSDGQTNESHAVPVAGQHGSSQFSDYPSVRSYHSSMFYPQQMM